MKLLTDQIIEEIYNIYENERNQNQNYEILFFDKY